MEETDKSVKEIEKEIDRLNRENDSLRQENQSLARDVKAAIFQAKTENPPASIPTVLLDGIDLDKAIFLVEKGKKLVKDMSFEDKLIMRRNMKLAETRTRVIGHGIALSIIEDEERAGKEEREAQKALDKKYSIKKAIDPVAEEERKSPGKNAFEKLVKSMMDMGMDEKQARDMAVNTIVSHNMGQSK